MGLCRLCTGDKDVVDIFKLQLEYGERLRQCVLLATGVNYNCGQSPELPDSDIDEIKKAILALYSNVKDALSGNINSEINQLKLKLNITGSTEEITVPTPKKHPSVEKLHKDNKNFILPEEVYNDNILPVVTLDTNEVTDWYSKQPMSSKSLSETDNCINSVDESRCSSTEENSFISDIICSDSDPEFFVGTVQLRTRTYRRILFESDSEDESPRKKTPRKSNNSSTTILPEIQIVHDRLSEKLNSRAKSVQQQQPSIAFITVNQESFGNGARKNYDSLEFRDYGIHFENTDPIYDDTITESCDGTDAEIELLFKKFYNIHLYIPTMCRNPNEEHVIQNIASDIRKYWVPIELHYANKNHRETLEETPVVLNIENDDTFWTDQQCIDIQKPRCTYQNQFPKASNITAHLPIADTIIIEDSDDEANYDHLTIDANFSDAEEVIVVDDDVPSAASTISFNNEDNQFLFNSHSRTITNPILNSECYGFIPQTSSADTRFEAIQNEPRRYLLPTEIPTPLLEYERQQSSVSRNGVVIVNNVTYVANT